MNTVTDPMDESRESYQPKNWEIQPDGSVTLDPIGIIGFGHLDMYLADPEYFGIRGIAVKGTVSKNIIALYREHEARGEKLRVKVIERIPPRTTDLILQYMADVNDFPWRLIADKQ